LIPRISENASVVLILSLSKERTFTAVAEPIGLG